jgi:uncharacterized protein
MLSFLNSRESLLDEVSERPYAATSTYEFAEPRPFRAHARDRLQIEREHEAQLFERGFSFFPIVDMTSSRFLIRTVLTLAGLYRRGLANAKRVEVRHNLIKSKRLPAAFDGFTILHLSDLHADINREAMELVAKLVRTQRYDLCVFTGDFRGETFGPCEPALAQLAPIRDALTGPLYAVLGNHDSIAMVPALEQLGVRVLLNECEAIERGDKCIHLAGIDDAHFYQLDNVERAAAEIPLDGFSILISHTPEIYERAARAGFAVLMCGHTHGGQICLPGGIPLTLDSDLPRRMGSGAWNYHGMIGYTSVGAGSSVVPVRYNCPPEITLHHLQAS